MTPGGGTPIDGSTLTLGRLGVYGIKDIQQKYLEIRRVLETTSTQAFRSLALLSHCVT